MSDSIYKFSDFVNYQAGSLNEMFGIEKDWFDKVVGVIARAGVHINPLNKRELFETITKSLDDQVEITSIGQIAFIIQVIEETKSFKMEMLEENSFKEIVKVVTKSLDEFENA